MDKIASESGKTKPMAKTLSSLPCKGSGLLVIPKHEKNIVQAARNIKGFGIIEAKNLNALQAASFKYLILPKESIKVIENTFSNK
jgi:ribosomal protein L4